MEDAHYTI